MSGPTEPRFYDLDDMPPRASLHDQMICMVFNYINHPTLLNATPIATDNLWTSPPFYTNTMESIPFTGVAITHFRQTILVSDPAYPELFQTTRLDELPFLHHVIFTISSRILHELDGRRYELLLRVVGFDSNGEKLQDQADDKYSGSVGYIVGGWRDAENVDDEMPGILREVFKDWKCIVEYFKYSVSCTIDRENGLTHPLLHMNVIGYGRTFRRGQFRKVYGMGSMVVGNMGGVTTLLQSSRIPMIQELREDGLWHDID